MGITSQFAASRLIQPGVISSSSERPAAPYEGQCIYQKDTDQVLYWNGSGWYPAWNTAWGILGISESSTSFATSSTHTTFQDTGLSVSCSYGPNRKLRVTAQIRPYPNGGLQFVNYKILRGSTDICTIAYGTCDLSASEAPTKTYSWTFNGPATAGTETFKMQIKAASNNTQITDYAATDGSRQFVVEDIGPA